MRLPAPPLLVITDRRQARRPLEDIAAAAFAGGCRWLSLREKDLPAAERRDLLRRLVALGRSWGAVVGVHEDVAAARAEGAGAIHLPDGTSPAAARAALGAAVVIGVSAHDAPGIARAAAAGADYVTISPVFASASKPGYGPALGVEAVATMASAAAIPVRRLGRHRRGHDRALHRGRRGRRGGDGRRHDRRGRRNTHRGAGGAARCRPCRRKCRPP